MEAKRGEMPSDLNPMNAPEAAIENQRQKIRSTSMTAKVAVLEADGDGFGQRKGNPGGGRRKGLNDGRIRRGKYRGHQ